MEINLKLDLRRWTVSFLIKYNKERCSCTPANTSSNRSDKIIYIIKNILKIIIFFRLVFDQ